MVSVRDSWTSVRTKLVELMSPPPGLDTSKVRGKCWLILLIKRDLLPTVLDSWRVVRVEYVLTRVPVSFALSPLHYVPVVFLYPDGLEVTSAALLQDNDKVVVSIDGGPYRMKISRKDSSLSAGSDASAYV